MIRYCLAAIFATALPAPALAQAEAWWGHVTALAHDSMRGRETGSPEHRKAAEYVASVFQRAGLRPAGSDGWFQPVRFRVRRIHEPRSSLALVRGGKAERLAFGTDATINLRGSSAGTVDAPLAFIGYGLVSPEHGYDDLKGLDLKGKVAVVLAGAAPGGIPGPALAAARAAGAEALGAAGAIGVLTVASPHADIPWERYALSRLHPQLRFAADTTSSSPHTAVTVVLNHEKAERLFEGTPQRYAALQALADSGAPLPRFALPVRLRATIAVDEGEAVSDNVVGLLPGTDPAAASEYVALTAHLDHLGVGQAQGGDSIYNGAMDNASGIATLLEAATALGRRPTRPRRSLLFVAVTAEEKGLLGSDWFAEHPTVPEGADIVANLNTDMFLPLNPLRQLLVNGLEESDLADDVRRAASQAGIAVITDPEPERNAFVRSDQFSFIRRGIPALSLKGGFALGTPEHARILRWRQERYHGVEDEVTQPVDRQAAADFNRLYPEVILEVANRPTRPAWYPTSAFRPETAASH
ncbi:MAG TPA: M28 family peptidase [Gemmatimonadales bacterium]|nr:M28 family peptidase [Gemmatimonadales bacterium]